MNASEHYRVLKRELEVNNCFKNQSSYIPKFLLVSLLFITSYFMIFFSLESDTKFLGVLGIAFTSIQSAFLAHEAGDGSVTKNKNLRSLIPQFYMTFLSGLSFSYFMELHKIHHNSMTKGSKFNGKPENKYEIKAIKKFVSFSPTLFMFATILLRGFTLKAEGINFLMRNRNFKMDLLFLMGHLILWMAPSLYIGWIPTLIIYSLVTLFGGFYAGLVLIVNHAGMATSIDVKDLPFIERIGTKTRNLPSNLISDILWGGINNHIEHHLYPSIPSSNLGKARKIVKNYFLKNNLPYRESSFLYAIKEARIYFTSLTPEERILEPLN